MAWYCSKECQAKHWPVHKIFCKGRGASAPADDNETLRNTQKALAQSSLGCISSDPYARASSLPRGKDQIIGTSIPAAYWDGEGNASGGHTECAIPAWLKDPILEQPGFPYPIPSPVVPAHRLGPSPGAGIGLFATRDLAAGELIFAERALLIAPHAGVLMTDILRKRRGRTSVQGVELAVDGREDLLRLSLARMTPEKQAAYHALANVHAHATETPLLGVQLTNAIVLPSHVLQEAFPGHPMKDGQSMSGVCEVLSRVNHSCSPNAIVGFHLQSFTYVLTAARAISAGTEITRTYIDHAEPTAERQRALRPSQITSTTCQPLATVSAWMRDPALSDDHLIQESKRFVRLVQEEGMEANARYYGIHLLQLALSYAALGDRERYLEARENMMALGRGHRPMNGGEARWVLTEVPEKQMLWGHRVPMLD
ncbi:hypothetical protein EWM64_g519 [Hericium alpestre]|uniref:SET domain-containing protein n=1 Tax=Hericium alpestre TaxID=135208 RepID=A0A4Z0ACP2_9AGAM|nr:hypothetical protein EWM64_g519 [Hericium alpestre]